ncbi:hypothetical protein Tco_0214976 [Tanacetum coccineum]
MPIWPILYKQHSTPDLRQIEKIERSQEEEQVFIIWMNLKVLRGQARSSTEEAEALRKEYAQSELRTIVSRHSKVLPSLSSVKRIFRHETHVLWQLQKADQLATSTTTDAEYVAAASCCGQVLSGFKIKCTTYTLSGTAQQVKNPIDPHTIPQSPAHILEKYLLSTILETHPLDHHHKTNCPDSNPESSVGEEKENDENMLSTEDVLSTDKEKVSTDKEKGTEEANRRVLYEAKKKMTEDHTEEESVLTQATQTPTSTIYGDEEIKSNVLLNHETSQNQFSREKEKGVPHPLNGDYTPKQQQEFDESLYVYGKKEPQKPESNVSDDKSSAYSTCQSNNSEGSIGNSSEHAVVFESETISVPKEMSESKPVTTNEKVVSKPKPKEVEPSCVSHVKTSRQQMKNLETPKINRKNWNEMMERELREGYSFTKKKCFVCGSLSHLIKDCDYHEKKMAREAELKKQRVFITENGVAKPVWTNANRVNHANQFVPRSVQLNAGRPNINSVRPNINTGRTNVNSVRPRVNTGSSNVNTVRSRQPVPTRTSNSFSPKRPQVNQFNQRRHFSKSHSPVRRPIDRNTAKMSYFNAVKGNWGTAVKTSAGYNWRNSRPNSNCDSGPTFIRTDHPLKNMEDRGIFDSGCSGHMTGNKDHLDDFEELKTVLICGSEVSYGSHTNKAFSDLRLFFKVLGLAMVGSTL